MTVRSLSETCATTTSAISPGFIRQPQSLRDSELAIPRSDLLRVIQGVAVATKTSVEDAAPIAQCVFRIPSDHSTTRCNIDTGDHFHSSLSGDSCTLLQWRDALISCLDDKRQQQFAMLALSVAFLRQHSRQTRCAPVSPAVMSLVWGMIQDALTDPELDPPLCNAVRSAQGFLSVALCSLIENGNIDELFRLHVWLPDGKRGNQDYPVHSHQPFAQSWILAGVGVDQSWNVEPADEKTATHAEYVPAWSDGKTLSSTYKTHQTKSVIANTGILVRATPGEVASHVRDMTYSIPCAQFHASRIRPDAFHATLFFFDSQRGFEKNASVLGPVDGESFAAHRDPAGVTAATLAGTVHAMRSWEVLMEQGRDHIRQGDRTGALKDFEDALGLCEPSHGFACSPYYKNLTLRELEVLN